MSGLAGGTLGPSFLLSELEAVVTLGVFYFGVIICMISTFLTGTGTPGSSFLIWEHSVAVL